MASEVTKEDRERAVRFFYPESSGPWSRPLCRYIDHGGAVDPNMRVVADLAQAFADLRSEVRRKGLEEAAKWHAMQAAVWSYPNADAFEIAREAHHKQAAAHFLALAEARDGE